MSATHTNKTSEEQLPLFEYVPEVSKYLYTQAQCPNQKYHHLIKAKKAYRSDFWYKTCDVCGWFRRTKPFEK